MSYCPFCRAEVKRKKTTFLQIKDVQQKSFFDNSPQNDDLDEHAEVHHTTPPHPVDAQELLVDQPAQGPVLEHDPEGLGAPEKMTWGHESMMRTMMLIMRNQFSTDSLATVGPI